MIVSSLLERVIVDAYAQQIAEAMPLEDCPTLLKERVCQLCGSSGGSHLSTCTSLIFCREQFCLAKIR